MKTRMFWTLLLVTAVVGVLAAFANPNRLVSRLLDNKVTPKVRPSATPPDTPKNGDMVTFKELVSRIKALRGTGSLEELTNEQKHIEDNWGQTGGQYYGLLYRDLLVALTTEKIIKAHPESLDLVQDYVDIALKKSDTFDFETEWSLLMYLRYPTTEGRLDIDQLDTRRHRTELWLHLLKRIREEKDINFNRTDLPALNVQPPEGSNIIAGMSPDAISDPVLRDQYKHAIKENSEKAAHFSHQVRLRQVEDSIVRNAVKYISIMYSKAPYNSGELDDALEKYFISDDIILRISKEISNYKDMEL